MTDPTLPAPAVTPAAIHRPGVLPLALGVVFPAAVIGFELVTRLCAAVFFDPLATAGHVALVAAVPLVNLALWIRLRGAGRLARWWPLAGGAAAGVATFYALLFLPLYPLSLVAAIYYGLGLLPFGPVAALGAAAALTASAAFRTRRGSFLCRPWVGVVLGLVAVTLLDLPAAATRLALRWAASDQPGQLPRGLALMRLAGDEDLLLRLCYDATGRPSGLLSALAMGWGWADPAAVGAPGPADAREFYYRLTGEPFDAVPPPYRSGPWSFARAFELDADQGGAAVGGRQRGLSLGQSRLDGSIAADEALAYLEWTLELRNDAAASSEARMTLALPPGAVVSRATLWIDGEPREAAFGTRAAARRAYQQVVQRRRDPLLVTTSGPDRVLVQAFPVPAGGRLQLRIGITAPLDLPAADAAALRLPAIVDRNFSIGGELRHAVWLEGRGRVLSADPALQADSPLAATFRVRGELSDAELAGRRPRLVAARSAAAVATWTPGLPAGDRPAAGRTGVLQTIEPAAPKPPGALMIVLDGSAKAAPARAALTEALALVPDGAMVGLAIAGEADLRFAPAPWSAARRTAIAGALSAATFRGGQDNTAALAEAVLALEPYEGATLLWISGPQPVRFRRDAGRLDQALDRAARLPTLILYPVGPGPNEVLADRPWFWDARSVAWSGDPAADLGALLADTYDPAPRWRIGRTLAPEAADLPRGSRHIVRLWAAARVLALAARGDAARAEAAELAAAYRLVTPVSGAVVLESPADYARSDLTPPDAAAVPTIPEPSAWALLLLVATLLAWLAWRRRAMAAVAA